MLKTITMQNTTQRTINGIKPGVVFNTDNPSYYTRLGCLVIASIKSDSIELVMSKEERKKIAINYLESIGLKSPDDFKKNQSCEALEELAQIKKDQQETNQEDRKKEELEATYKLKLTEAGIEYDEDSNIEILEQIMLENGVTL